MRINKTMKPFDLKLALSGHPVISRDRRQVIHIMHDPGAPPARRVYGRYEDGGFDWHYENGTICQFEDSPADLFMASTKREAWVNVYEHEVTGHFSSKAAADSIASKGRRACIRIEWEE